MSAKHILSFITYQILQSKLAHGNQGAKLRIMKCNWLYDRRFYKRISFKILVDFFCSLPLRTWKTKLPCDIDIRDQRNNN